ncbi:PAS domain S-box protein [Natrinema sp. SYSU A 869]|uniref:PAS domain S-box protein n=1 Tax=Natrinema sp. SYSU A 869 TaxID=2871694 RepID=UPI001CA438E8|nr:PAS domain S-box protein [Natrinema sp. SYSU A 869]
MPSSRSTSTIQSVNPAIEAIFGYEPDELLGEPLTILMPDERAEQHRQAIARYLETGERSLDWEYVELPGRRRNGTEVPLAISFNDVDHEGERFFTGIVRDITERKRIEAELREREERFRQIAENIEEGFWMTPPDKQEVLYMNLAYEEIWGRSRESLYDEPLSFLDAIHPEDRDRVRDALDTQPEGEYDEQYRVVQPNGTVRWVRDRAFPIEDKDGEVARIVGITEDITDRKEFEQQLKALNDTAQQLLTTATREEVSEKVVTTVADVLDLPLVAYYRHDDDENALVADAQTATAEFSGQQFPTLPAKGKSLAAAAYAGGERRHYHTETESSEVQVNTSGTEMRSGLYVPVDDHGVIVAGACEIGMIGVQQRQFVDILAMTAQAAYDRVEREQDLHDAKQRFEAATEAGGVGTWEWHVQEDEMVTGPAFARLFGVDPDAAQEEVSLDRFVSSIHEDDRGRVEAAIEEALETCGEYKEDYRVWNADGELRWVVAQGHVECDDDGNPVTFPGALTDITKRWEYRQKVEESNERLEQFAYAVSHDLQEPLRMVSSYLQLLEDRYRDKLDDDAQEFIDFAVDGADRMQSMIEGLLAYSRVETQGESFEPVELEAVLDDVLDDLQLRIEESSAEITTESLPTVDGDRDQLYEVFQNLVSNAIKYAGDAPPRIHITADRNGRKWIISVTDNGIGIAPDEQERIFEVFERLHTREEQSGIGMGLALCQRIIERHGGDIWVESTPGDGSTFFIAFPAAERKSNAGNHPGVREKIDDY